MRVMTVRNRWVTKGGQAASAIIDKAEFEKIKKNRDLAVKRWIDKQMEGTFVTVVLLGKETLKRPFVKYEICKSIECKNAIIGVHINSIKDARTMMKAPKANVDEIVGYYEDNTPAYFDEICNGMYDYVLDDGYSHLGEWVEEAAKKVGK